MGNGESKQEEVNQLKPAAEDKKAASNHDKTLLVGQYAIDISDDTEHHGISKEIRNVIAHTSRSVVQLYRNKKLASTGVAAEITSTASKSIHAILLPHFTGLYSCEEGDTFELSLCHLPGALTFPLHLQAIQSFTCPILDVALVWLDDGSIQSLLEHQCSFLRLECSSLLHVASEAEVFLVGGCSDSSSVKFGSGQAKEYYGLQLKFNMLQCDFAVAGLPLVSANGTLIGLYKYTTGANDLMISTAAAMAYVIPMMEALVDRPIECNHHLLSNPIDLSLYGNKLSSNAHKGNQENDKWENGIDVCSLERGRYMSSLVYVSPSSPYVTPIWYVPTYLGWYWTPNDPGNDEEPNWMSVSCLAVVGGSWNSQIPAKKNVQIISWLQDNNIACGNISV